MTDTQQQPPQQPKNKPVRVDNPYEQALEKQQKKDALRKKPDLPENRVDRFILNFTRLPEKLIEAALSNTVNYTPLDVDKHDEAAKLAAVRRQLQYLRGEEDQARAHFKNVDNTRRREEVEKEQQAAETEKQKALAEQQEMEPSSKQARGSLFGGKKKKPQKTIENKAAQGKN